jgi:hypothetical protein
VGGQCDGSARPLRAYSRHNRIEANVSATVPTSQLPPIEIVPPIPDAPLEREQSSAGLPLAPEDALEHRRRAGERPLGEQPASALLARMARLEGSLGAALSLLRRCIVERKTPTRDALAAEAGFALGMAPDAALAELDEIAQIVGVSSLR